MRLELDVVESLMFLGESVISSALPWNVDQNVLFIGNTGSGKSTLVNYLTGARLKAIESDNPDGDFNIDLVDADTTRPKIGHQLSSQTTVPNRLVDFAQRTVYWDCPGFLDTKGHYQDIANCYYIKRLFDTLENIKIVVVVPLSECSGKATNFTKILDRLADLFLNDIDKIMECLTVVITKTKPNADSKFRNWISKAFAPKAHELTKNPKTLDIIKFLASEGQSYRVVCFPAPIEDNDVSVAYRDVISSTIGSCVPVQKVKVSITVAPESKLEVIALFKSFEKGIESILKVLIENLIQEFKEIQSVTFDRIASLCNWVMSEATEITSLEELFSQFQQRLSEIPITNKNTKTIGRTLHYFQFFRNNFTRINF